jgi:hypothetical protein
VKNLKIYILYLCVLLNGCNAPDYYEVKNSTINNAIVHMWPDGKTELFDSNKIYYNFYRLYFEKNLNIDQIKNIENKISKSCHHRFFIADLKGSKRYFFQTKSRYFIAKNMSRLRNLNSKEIENLLKNKPFYRNNINAICFK